MIYIKEMKMRPRREPEVVPTEHIIPILGRNGMVERYDERTGRKVHESELKKEIVEPFNKTKAELICTLLSEAVPLSEALERTKTSRVSYNRWRRYNDEFKFSLADARASRADNLHEKFFEDELSTDTSIDKEDLFNEQMYYKVVEAKQKVYSKFKEEDAPHRYGIKHTKGSMEHVGNYAINLKIDEKVMDAIEAEFTPIINEEGEVVLNDGDEREKGSTVHKR